MSLSMEQLQAAMTEADTAYVEKTGKQPFTDCWVYLHQTGEWTASIWHTDTGYDQKIKGYGDTPECALADLMDKIASIPSMEEQHLREFQRDLGKLIDKGRDYGIDVDFVNPLIATAKRLAENALTDQRASA